MVRSDSVRNGQCENDLIFRKLRRSTQRKREIDAERKRDMHRDIFKGFMRYKKGQGYVNNIINI